MGFLNFSDSNPAAKAVLNPLTPNRCWNDFSETEKELIWEHLEKYFFTLLQLQQFVSPDGIPGNQSYDVRFSGKKPDEVGQRILHAIISLNKKYKAQNYAPRYFKFKTGIDACLDFARIYMREDEAVVLELLSFYLDFMRIKADEEGDTGYKDFNEFSTEFNELLGQFNFRYKIIANQFVPVTEDKIAILYKPVLQVLSDPKWHVVNKCLSDAIKNIKEGEPSDYSASITNSYAAIETYLQIVVHQKTGKGMLSGLLGEAQDKGKIPSDAFTRKIFSSLESSLAEDRKNLGLPHGTPTYATLYNAQLILNLAIVFLNHCILYPSTE